MSKKIKFNDDYVSFGFTCIQKTEDLQRPCMLCETVLSNANLKLSKLQKHFDNQCGSANVLGHDENVCKLKDPVLIL